MVIGAMRCELIIPGSRSLKDKRRVVQSMISRTRRKFNVAVAETGYQDMWNVVQLGVVCVSNDSSHAHRVLEAVASDLDKLGEAALERFEIEIL